jgi:hypothetical protein
MPIKDRLIAIAIMPVRELIEHYSAAAAGRASPRWGGMGR